jgi:hypothetical protein
MQPHTPHTMYQDFLRRTLALLAMLVWPLAPLHADEGHDHGDAAATADGPALPRFTAVSELFELVGVLDGQRLTLFLDHAPSNAPVKGAKLELELAGARVAVQAKADTEGEFEVMLPAVPASGVMAVTATVMAGDETDLLAGELDIHEHAALPSHAHASAWQPYAGWAVAGLLALVLLALGLRSGLARLRQAPRQEAAA